MNYSNSKGMKGDAVFETSTIAINGTNWNSDLSNLPYKQWTVFLRSYNYEYDEPADVFAFICHRWFEE